MEESKYKEIMEKAFLYVTNLPVCEFNNLASNNFHIAVWDGDYKKFDYNFSHKESPKIPAVTNVSICEIGTWAIVELKKQDDTFGRLCFQIEILQEEINYLRMVLNCK